MRLFARARQLYGAASTRLRLPEGANPGACFDALVAERSRLEPLRERLLVAVNEKYASWDRPLSEGDTVAFIPPVSGG